MSKRNGKTANTSPVEDDAKAKAASGEDQATSLGLARVPGQPMALTLDTALYERYLADADLTEGQKHEFLQSLWSLIVGFVDLGFGIHPLQQSGNPACGQNFDPATVLAADMVPSLMPLEPGTDKDAVEAKEGT